MRTNVIVFGFVALVACGAASGDHAGDGGPTPPGEAGPPHTGADSAAAPGYGGSSGGSSAGSDAGIPTGVLTAGAWDDNLNYEFFSAYLATKGSVVGAPPISSTERDAAHLAFANRTAKQRLDVSIVIDTTGSMGDEAAYLKAEVQNISGSIAAQFPNADQHWSLVAYRDRPDTDPGDEYVTRTWDFTSDLTAFASSVGSLTANNGGDYEEAPELGLAAMNQLSWRTDADVARLAFWIGDAPQHASRGPDIAQTFRDSRTRDIHLYPVAASGANDLLELTMRSGAQLTGGRYSFLTDDSGIGDAHEIPSVPCFFVTKLAAQIVRMVSIELSGVYHEPAASDVIRTAGDPTSGACTLADAGTVSVF